MFYYMTHCLNIYPLGQLLTKVSRIMSPMSQITKLRLTVKITSPDKCQDVNDVPSLALPRGHREASLLEDGLSGLEK